MFDGWITRDEENLLPAFSTHKEAFYYFKGKYAENFIMQSVDKIDGQECFFCALIVNHEAYRKGRNQLMRGEAVTDFEYVKSYQPIQIMQDGSVHIVH